MYYKCVVGHIEEHVLRFEQPKHVAGRTWKIMFFEHMQSRCARSAQSGAKMFQAFGTIWSASSDNKFQDILSLMIYKIEKQKRTVFFYVSNFHNMVS